MKILFISNFYPPYELGGWEQLTQEINTILRRKGHQTNILTSRYKSEIVSRPESGIFRKLYLESGDLEHYHLSDWLQRKSRDCKNQKTIRKLVQEFHPDIIFVHSLWNISKVVPWMAENILPGRVVYYIASDWPYYPSIHEIYWNSPTRHKRYQKCKRTLAKVINNSLRQTSVKYKLSFDHVICVSDFIRRELSKFGAVPLANSKVIYNGVDTSVFTPPINWDPRKWQNGAPSFLYVGGLYHHKGVHTAIEAFYRSTQNPLLNNATLNIIGSGHPEYEKKLKNLVKDLGLKDRIFFIGRIPRERIPEIMKKFDVLIFPSIWQEPLARTMQEAMACGLVIIGTTTGGSKELLIDGETGLTFEPSNTNELMYQIIRIVSDPDLRWKLAKSGRHAVVEHFNIEKMIYEIEKYLVSVINFPPNIT